MKNLKTQSSKKTIIKAFTLSILMVILLSSISFAAGDPVDNLTDYAMQKIGVVFLVIVAFYITKNIAKNATTKLIGFVLIAIIGGVLVYKPEFIQQGADWLYNIIF